MGLIRSQDWDVAFSCFFEPFFMYEEFFNMGYKLPGFRLVQFLEKNDLSSSVESAFTEKALSELTIPVSGPLLKGLRLGIMLTFSLANNLYPGWSL